MAQFKDLTGQKFGKLLALKRVGSRRSFALWFCVCDCGKHCEVVSHHLIGGKAKSCGCARNIKHGYARAGQVIREYMIWAGIIQRCENRNLPEYPYYGGRGIRVCDRWRNSFVNFFDDMGPRPSKDYSIDRINPDGNYTPENCRWITRSENSKRARRNKKSKYVVKGETLVEASMRLGCIPEIVYSRIRRGWDLEKAFTVPIRNYNQTSSV